MKVLYSIWNTEVDNLKNNLSQSIHSTLNDDVCLDLNNGLNLLKNYCETCAKKSLKKNNLNALLNTISSLMGKKSEAKLREYEPKTLLRDGSTFQKIILL